MTALSMATGQEAHQDKAAELYQCHGRLMLATARRMLNDPYLAEDAVSEAFIRILNNLDKINRMNGDQIRGFVVIIVRNICIDMLRKQGRSRAEPLEEEYEGASEWEEPVFEEVSVREACARLSDAVGRLRKEYSDVLYLKMEFGFSAREIADVLKIRPETVKMRLIRGRKALREQMGREELMV